MLLRRNMKYENGWCFVNIVNLRHPSAELITQKVGGENIKV